jgi:hypothetical protein
MFGLFAHWHQQRYVRAAERMNLLQSISGRRWKCGPWRWRT